MAGSGVAILEKRSWLPNLVPKWEGLLVSMQASISWELKMSASVIRFSCLRFPQIRRLDISHSITFIWIYWFTSEDLLRISLRPAKGFGKLTLKVVDRYSLRQVIERRPFEHHHATLLFSSVSFNFYCAICTFATTCMKVFSCSTLMCIINAL